MSVVREMNEVDEASFDDVVDFGMVLVLRFTPYFDLEFVWL